MFDANQSQERRPVHQWQQIIHLELEIVRQAVQILAAAAISQKLGQAHHGAHPGVWERRERRAPPADARSHDPPGES